MKNFKKTLCGFLFGLVGFGAVAATVSDVTARQRYPWNGKIDIDYTATGSDTTNTALAVMLMNHDTGQIYSLTESGRHQFTWSRTDLVASNVTATASLVSYRTPLCCMIDLSGGPNATRWPVSYFSVIPSRGWTDEYKKTKLVLLRIESGTFVMDSVQTCESHRVTLTKPFYMGIFEVTQKQWELVMGAWPDYGSRPSSYYGCGDIYPAYGVSYNDIRGASSGGLWPASAAVDTSSFLGRLRAKTGLDFDLPTEAQWEYACRAGTTTTYYWGDLMGDAYAWYYSNSSSKIHPVGMKFPNAWGLYDMGGNVYEWCRDWYGALAYGTDPLGVASGSNRVRRGGSWDDRFSHCASSYRNFSNPPSLRVKSIGFRLVMALPD